MKRFFKKHPEYSVYLVLALLCLIIYAQVVRFEFIVLDDNMYVTENPWVQQAFSWGSLRWAFTTGYFFNWHPMTWLSHMLDFTLYGMSAGGHHATSGLLHLANAILVFELVRRLTGAWGRSALVALLFAVHPLRVESVAWVSERKDVLSAFFGLLTMLAYMRYARRPSVARYAAMAACCALALMSKSMLVTLPCVLLLLDYWPLERIDLAQIRTRKEQRVLLRLILEKAPLLLLAAATGVIAMAFKTPQTDAANLRVANAFRSYGLYLLKTFWPTHLSVAYALPGKGVPIGEIVLAVAALAAITSGVLMSFRRRRGQSGDWRSRRRYLLVGWLWFSGMLLPATGLVQISTHAMADRYTYLPSIGLALLVVWGIADLVAGRRLLRNVALGAGAVCIVALTFLSTIQTGYWRNNETLFLHAIRVNPQNAVALADLGTAYTLQGRNEEAVAMYQRAIGADPSYAIAHNDLAMALTDLGRHDEAVRACQEAIRLDPGYVNAYVNLGNALAALRRFEEAEAAYRNAAALDPANPTPCYNAGGVCMIAGRFVDAVRWYNRLFEIDPDHPMGHASLGRALMALGRHDEAAKHFEWALRAAQHDPELQRRIRAIMPADKR